MTYEDFTLDEVMDRFGLRVISTPDPLVAPAPVLISALLRDTLAESLPLAWSVSTDKARAEWIT